MNDMPDRPINPPDVQDVYICEYCGNEYPDDSWCRECHFLPMPFKIETTVKLIEDDDAFTTFCKENDYPADSIMLQRAFLAGTGHGLDIALSKLK